MYISVEEQMNFNYVEEQMNFNKWLSLIWLKSFFLKWILCNITLLLYYLETNKGNSSVVTSQISLKVVHDIFF